MPRLNEDNLQNFNGGHFGFSAVGVDDDALGASEYTLVCVVADHSGSTQGFQKPMEECLKEIIRSCQISPRADNLMVRYVAFDNNQDEIHGFRFLTQCNLNDYDNSLPPKGSTALYDATINGTQSLANYGKDLQKKDFDVNGILFVITDGEENASTYGINQVKEAFAETIRSENLESLHSILIGVNVNDASVSRSLKAFHTNAGFSQYVELQDASPKTLAKLAQFVSNSISSQSQALGSGVASQSLTF